MNTHLEQWAAMLQCPGSSWGFGALLKDTSVVVLKEDTPPTKNPCRTWFSNPQPSTYKSDSLSIRPRLPPCYLTSGCWCKMLFKIRTDKGIVEDSGIIWIVKLCTIPNPNRSRYREGSRHLRCLLPPSESCSALTFLLAGEVDFVT